MTNPSNDPLASILSEAERNRRLDRAASSSANTVSTAASVGDYTVDATPSGTNAGNVVVLDANGKIPTRLLYSSALGGNGGTSPAYDHVQSVASTTWVIPHNLGGYPPPVIVDALGTEVHAEVRYPDVNHMMVLFGRPSVGAVHLTL